MPRTSEKKWNDRCLQDSIGIPRRTSYGTKDVRIRNQTSWESYRFPFWPCRGCQGTYRNTNIYTRLTQLKPHLQDFLYGQYDGLTGLYKEPIAGAKKDVCSFSAKSSRWCRTLMSSGTRDSQARLLVLEEASSTPR